MPVYCPSCGAGVEAVAKFCLQCGHDLETDGPITSTGHDVRQLKELIRSRDDLSMAEKFDLIAKVEEGANPIQVICPPAVSISNAKGCFALSLLMKSCLNLSKSFILGSIQSSLSVFTMSFVSASRNAFLKSE